MPVALHSLTHVIPATPGACHRLAACDVLSREEENHKKIDKYRGFLKILHITSPNTVSHAKIHRIIDFSLRANLLKKMKFPLLITFIHIHTNLNVFSLRDRDVPFG